MFGSKRVGRGAAVLAAGAAAALISATMAGEAQAAPVGVQQIPATALTSGGIGDWTPYSAYIRVETVRDWAHTVMVSAPTDNWTCNRLSMYTMIRFDWTNISNGRGGSATVQPCGGPRSGPRGVLAHTGPGQVIGTISIVGQGAPTPALPGGATFSVG